MPERRKQAPELVVLSSATISRLPGALCPALLLDMRSSAGMGTQAGIFSRLRRWTTMASMKSYIDCTGNEE
jgi:hypothetical protein